MAYYKCSKIIGMRRKELGYSRDAFDVDGPSGMTVYRMESGLHRNRESTYRTLTKCMGVEESLGQGLLLTLKTEYLNQVNEIMRNINEKHYEEAEGMLLKLKEELDCDISRNRQYIEATQAELDYRQGYITPEEYECKLKQALSYTVLRMEKNNIHGWPLRNEELALVMRLNNVLKRQKKREEQLNLMLNLKKVLEEEYICGELYTRYYIVSLLAIADALGSMGRNKEAVLMDRESIKLSLNNREYRSLSFAYYDLHWNLWELKQIETLSEKDEIECRQSLLNAYYFAKASGSNYAVFEKRLKERYPEESGVQ